MARKGSDEVKEAQEALKEARKAAKEENAKEASGPVTLPAPDDAVIYETDSAVLCLTRENIKASLDSKIVLSETEGAYFTIHGHR